jgi:hypothetical protein
MIFMRSWVFDKSSSIARLENSLYKSVGMKKLTCLLEIAM